MALLWGELRAAATPALALAIAYLALVVTIGGMGLWLWLIRVSGAATASSYHLLNPLFAVLLSHLAFGTPIRPADGLGGGLVALGLLLVARTARARAAAAGFDNTNSADRL